MKTYWRILGFAKPIEKYAIPYFLYTLLHVVFYGIVFMLIMPLIQTLISPEESKVLVTSMPEFTLSKAYAIDVINYQLYNIFGESYDMVEVLAALAVVLVVVMFFSSLFRYLGQITVESMKINTLYRIRNATYNNVLSLSPGFFSNERKGDIMSKITSDVQVVQYCISNTMHVVFRDPIMIIGFLFLMISISWELTIFTAVYLPLMALLIGSVLKRLRKPAKAGQAAFGEMTSVLDESLSGMKVVKGYNAEGFFRQRFQKVNRLYSRIMKAMARRQQLASPMSEFLGILAVAGILIFGGMLVVKKTLAPEDFLAYLAIFTQITRPIRSFADAFANINQGIAAGERVFSLIDAKTNVPESPDAVELKSFEESIEFKDVRFAYGDREVIGGVSFSVKKGETVALVGPSGGGKSTLADLIPRFYDVGSGEITIDGRNIKEYTTESLRSVMGIVSQETILFNDTIENNIRLGNETATIQDVVAAAKVANAHTFILEKENGYETNIGDRGTKLSGGQRQRLSIARAVLKNPEILILDEATSALDTESEKLVQDALESLLKGRTSVVIAHRLSTIYNADRIIVVDEGVIVEQGTHAELMAKKGVYAKLIEMQQLS